MKGALMESLNKPSGAKHKLAYLTALTLLFSYAEMILPRFIPFFRLGLANTVMLLSIDIELSSFFLLAVLKAIAASLMGGTLLSPFFLISLLQSILSSLVMRFLHKTVSKKLLGIYGISVLGSALSALVQLVLASLYLGQGTMALSGPMLIFNSISGLITAAFSEILKNEMNGNLSDYFDKKISADDSGPANEDQNTSSDKHPVSGVLFAVFLLVFGISVFFVKNLYLLGFMFLTSLVLQHFSKRKIFWLPHLSLWFFIFITGVFSPSGKVIVHFWNISITKGALLLALQKALTLSTVSALSQCATSLKPDKNTLLGMSLDYYRNMSSKFREEKGDLIQRLIKSLV